MAAKSKYFHHTHLTNVRGWSDELILRHLGDPDLVQQFPREAGKAPDRLYFRARVEDAEQDEAISAIILPRRAELAESKTERAARRARLLQEAADAAEIVVETLPLFEVKIRALETLYKELARKRKNAPRTWDAQKIADLAFKFATRRLVDYDRIIAALPVPLDKADAYELCRERIDAAVIAVYPQIAPAA
jgi:hypothetical protein